MMDIIDKIEEQMEGLREMGEDPAVIIISEKTAKKVREWINEYNFTIVDDTEEIEGAEIHGINVRIIHEIEGHFVMVLPKRSYNNSFDDLYDVLLERELRRTERE